MKEHLLADITAQPRYVWNMQPHNWYKSLCHRTMYQQPTHSWEQSLRRFWPIALASVAVASSQSPAQAVQFSFSYQPGISFQQIAATELAGNVWSSYLTDSDVTVNLHIGMTSGLGAGRLGGATPAIQKTNYDKFKDGLQDDGTADINLLSTSPQGSNKFSSLQQDGSVNHSRYELNLTTANNKALGNDLSGDASGLDGYIQLEQSANWHYDYTAGALGQNQYDFTSVMLHEIGHNLGFISGLDTLGTTSLPTALDMFRYSSDSEVVEATDYRIGGESYFSVDGGETAFTLTDGAGTETEALFSTGENIGLGGDGDQASHWKVDSSPALGIMSAKVGAGEYRQISEFDLTALDYLGWDVDHNANANLALLGANASAKAGQIWSDYASDPGNSAIQNRSSDVAQMMQKSGIYHLGYGQWWQSNAEQSSQEVPEPTSILALFAMTLFGITTRRQKPVS